MAAFVALLGELRAWAGLPSYRALAKRVGPLMRPAREVSPFTVVDAFKEGRRRLDLDLVLAIVRALDVPEADVPRWREACVRVHGPTRTGGSAGVLRQLPADLATFTGREEELKRLLEECAPAGDGPATTVVVSAIEGMGGVGKTQLAVHAAHALVRAGRYREMQLYVNLRGFDPEHPPADPADVLDGLLRQLGVPPQQVPQGLDERAAMFRDRIHGRDVLLLLDNAAGEEQVRDLIPATPTCLVLVTSRRSLAALDGAALHVLDVFAPGEALDLLSRIAGADRVGAEPGAAAEIAALCGQLPLAVSLVAARLRSRPTWTLEHVARLLRQDGAHSVAPRNRHLWTAFDLSHDGLPADTARLFRLLGLQPGHSFTARAAAALAGVPEPEAAAALELLLDEHLVQELGQDSYALHDLLRAYAARRAETDEPGRDREAAQDRLLGWYLHTAESASRAVEPRPLPPTLPTLPGEPEPLTFASGAAALEWYDGQRDNLSAVVDRAAVTARHELCLRLSVALMGCYRLRRDWEPWQVSGEAGLAAARAVGDLAWTGRLLNGLGTLRDERGAYDESKPLYLEAVELGRELDDPALEAMSLSNLGVVGNFTRDFALAERSLKASLELNRRHGNVRSMTITLCNLGIMLEETGRDLEALDTYTEALTHARTLDSPLYVGVLQSNVGDTNIRLGRFTEAAEHLTESLALLREAGSRQDEANALSWLARAHEGLGDTGAAREALADALTIYEELDAPEAADVRARLGKG